MEQASEITSFRDLVAWQKARALVVQVYSATAKFPKEELYGLTAQLRRAAVSVPSNIAEGYGRGTRKDYVRFLQMARGSIYELQTQLIVGGDLGYMPPQQGSSIAESADECAALLYGLIKSLTRTNDEDSP